MSDSLPADSGTERQRLAAALKTLRLTAGLTTTDLAARLGFSQSKVSKTENGNTLPTPKDVRAWAQATQGADRADALVEMALRAATQVGSWRSVHASGLTRRQIEVAGIEASVTALQNFQPALIPGLLETADYARRVLTMMDVSGKRDIDGAVTARLSRQSVLFDRAKTFHFVMTEGALRWRPGSVETQRAQLHRLLAVMDLPNVTISVLPFSIEADVPYLSGFTIFEVPDRPQVLVEVLSTELVLEEPPDLALYRDAFGRAAHAALDRASSVAAIQAAMP